MLLILAVCLGVSAYAQNKFEKGYFIGNNGSKVECLIKNDDWKSNPTSFKYKTSETDDVKTGNLGNVKEFVIIGKSKYQKFTVDIDRSSNKTNQLSTKRTAEFTSETLFLKALVEGSKANLYGYVDNDLRRFFYKKPGGEVTQLVYKQYRSSNLGVRKNESYKAQLQREFPCDNANPSPSYLKSNLVKYFVAYNNCGAQDASMTDFTLTETKGQLKLKVKGGINYFKTTVTDTSIPFGDNKFSTDNEVNARFGVELEYLFAGNNNRWSVFLEPSYQSFKGDAELFIQGTVNITRLIAIDYQSIEVPIGIRYYIPVGTDNSKIFLSGGSVIDLPMGDSTVRNQEIRSSISFFFSAGYQYDKLSLEARYTAGRSLENLIGLDTTYGGLSLILGYTIF